MVVQNACNICGGRELGPWRSRSDNVQILRCRQCGMGVVERIPRNLAEIYESDSYYASTEEGFGYSDYWLIAEHSTSWAASLTRLLVPMGKVLDIGCADGHLLKKLAKSHRCFGIEINPKMAEACRSRGIQVIANSIYETQLKQYQETFDVVLAIAVLEHVSDFREAVETALSMVQPQGVFIFEVPLMSVDHSNSVWLRSSLEHIYYPNEASLRYLFETVCKQPLVGAEIVVRDYGSTYIGIASKGQLRAEEVRSLFQRVVLGPVEDLSSPLEIRCRLLISLVHAAQTETDLVTRLDQLMFGDFNSSLLRRLWALWRRDRERLDSTTAYLREVEAARNWHADQSRELDAELRRWKATAGEGAVAEDSPQKDGPAGKGKSG